MLVTGQYLLVLIDHVKDPIIRYGTQHGKRGIGNIHFDHAIAYSGGSQNGANRCLQNTVLSLLCNLRCIVSDNQIKQQR